MADTNEVDNFDDVQFDPGYDPLDLSAAYGEADEARGMGEDEPPGKKRRVMAKVDIDRWVCASGDLGLRLRLRATPGRC